MSASPHLHLVGPFDTRPTACVGTPISTYSISFNRVGPSDVIKASSMSSPRLSPTPSLPSLRSAHCDWSGLDMLSVGFLLISKCVRRIEAAQQPGSSGAHKWQNNKKCRRCGARLRGAVPMPASAASMYYVVAYMYVRVFLWSRKSQKCNETIEFKNYRTHRLLLNSLSTSRLSCSPHFCCGCLSTKECASVLLIDSIDSFTHQHIASLPYYV